MIDQFVEAAVICLCIAGLSYVAGLAIAHVVEQRVLASLRADAVDDRLQKLTLLLSRFKARREAMLPRMIRLDAQVKSVRRRHYMVQKRVADLSGPRSALVRVLGEEDAFQRAERPSRRFVAIVINRHVQRGQLEQKEHPFLARSWGRAQQVHVWAGTIGDAKVAVEKAFPPATGFFVVEISEPADDAQMMEAVPDLDLAATLARGAAMPMGAARPQAAAKMAAMPAAALPPAGRRAQG
ncbi:MAG: hypothetical protein RLY86_714 [Pseudomonadota bacterium]|jgi:hypothetical protein